LTLKRATSSSISFALFAAALPAVSGCVILGGADLDVTNSCSSSSDCKNGGVCADLGEGVQACVATKAELPDLILEVSPSAEASFGASKAFLMPFGGEGLVAELPEGLVVAHDIGLSEVRVSPIEAFVDYDYKNCLLPPGGKVAADFTFYRDAVHAGLPDYEARAFPLDGAVDAYAVDLPPGKYDIHVVPRAPEGCAEAPPPPTFHRGVDLSQGGKIDLHLTAPPRVITGTIGFPQGQDLTGWSIEVVEPVHGKLVSRSQVLAVEPLNLYATYNLDYYWESGPESSPILRLTPPSGVDAPKLFWQVASLNPLNTDESFLQADLVLIDLDAVGREVEAYVLDSDNNPVVASVAIKSIELSGNASKSANYNIVVDNDVKGRFVTKLPPGRYMVTAHPTADSTKAATTVPWEITPQLEDKECFCGNSIKLFDKSVVSGRVTLPNGMSFSSGAARLSSSNVPGRPYLASRLVADSAPSLPTATPLDPFGGFSILTDPGTVDLTVLPPAESRYPWLLRAQLHVKENVDGAQVFEFDEDLKFSYPVLVGGVVRDPSGQIVSNAKVRAWLPVIASGSTSETVVIQIAEGSTDANGRYSLALAPSL
jgi:hypothetical protein